MSGQPYDDKHAIARYIVRQEYKRLTAFERAVRNEWARQVKGAPRSQVYRASWTTPWRWCVERILELRVRRALRIGIEAFDQRIVERIEREDGLDFVPRCPECSGVLATRLARQCPWCPASWRDEPRGA